MRILLILLVNVWFLPINARHQSVVPDTDKKCESTKKLSQVTESDLRDWGVTNSPVMSLIEKTGQIDLSSLGSNQRTFSPKGTSGECKTIFLGTTRSPKCEICNTTSEILRLRNPTADNQNPNVYDYTINVDDGYEECNRKFNTREKNCKTKKDIVDRPGYLPAYDPREYEQTSLAELTADENNNGTTDTSRTGQLCLLEGFNNLDEQTKCRQIVIKRYPIETTIGLKLNCNLSMSANKSDLSSLEHDFFKVCVPFVREVELRTDSEGSNISI